MLYLKEHITSSTYLAIWKMEESKEELLPLLSHHEWIDHTYSIKSEVRVREILTARILIKELTGDEKEVCYNNSGKPSFADNSYHISISHTKGYVAVAINKDKHIGLDIEYISEKVKRVQSRFISETEYIDKDNELTHLLLHWSAKEAMFKFIDVEGVNFLSNLFVWKFMPQKDSGTFQASETRTQKTYKFDAHYKIDKDFVLVCLEANN